MCKIFAKKLGAYSFFLLFCTRFQRNLKNIVKKRKLGSNFYLLVKR